MKRRYGSDNPDLQKAWNILIHTLYSCDTKRHGPQGSYFAMRPTPDFSEGPFARAHIFYDPEKVKEALARFIKAADQFEDSETFRYDIMDLTRQAMSDHSQQLLAQLKVDYEAGNSPAFRKNSQHFLQAIQDLDTMLSGDPMFMVSRWLENARQRAHTPEQASLYEFNARNLITQWGPKNTKLKDYAQRQYGGMMGDFNHMRWKLFFDHVNTRLDKGKKLDWDLIDEEISDWEEHWAHDQTEYPSEVNENYITQVKKIYRTYLED